jgi:hypothetical protein
MASNPFSESGRGARPSLPTQPLGTVIFQKGLLSAEQLLEALEEGHRSRRRLGDLLLERGWLDERALAETLAEQYGLPVVDLDPDEVDPEAARLISASDSERLGAIVMGIEDGAAVVALSDPSDGAALAELEEMLPGALFAVAPRSRVAEALTSVFSDDGELRAPASAEAPVVDDSAAPDEFVADEEVALEPAEPLTAHAPESVALAEAALDAGQASAEPAEPEERTDDLGWDFAAPAESVPSEVSSHQPAASPAPVAMQERVAVPEDAAGVSEGPLESQEPDQAADDLSWAFTAPAETVPPELGSHAASGSPAIVATANHVVTPENAQLNGHAADAATASVVVARLADGSTVELGSFADRASASRRAAELIEQLMADESTGWTEIEGSYFRPQAIIAVDVAVAGG